MSAADAAAVNPNAMKALLANDWIKFSLTLIQFSLIIQEI